MDASCTIQDSIHVFSLVHKYVSSILGTYHSFGAFFYSPFLFITSIVCKACDTRFLFLSLFGKRRESVNPN